MEQIGIAWHKKRHWREYQISEYSTYLDSQQSLTKKIFLRAGCNSSYLINHHRSDVWIFIDSERLFKTGSVITKVSRGDIHVIHTEQKHTAKSLSDLAFIKVQYINPLVKENTERLNLNWTA